MTKAFDQDYEPPGNAPIDFSRLPVPNRDGLLVRNWLTRDLPERDYLMGELLCTTSRWLLIGETGLGKTLFSMEFGGAVAAGAEFLGWQGHRRARVIYLDGEMPGETFKERIELIAAAYGSEIELFGYNRDVLGADDMPPLNTDAGQAWLWREIEAIEPALIIFDSIMCLLTGSMTEEESWAPVKGLVRQISARRIAQIWVHHTGHNAGKGFGTKTREWEMDTVVMLSQIEGEPDTASSKFQLEFRKARLRKPSNFDQFATKTVTRTEIGFTFERAAAKKAAKKASELELVQRALVDAYDRLADGVAPSSGFNGHQVRKVSIDLVRDEMKNRGILGKDDRGHIDAAGRKNLQRAKLSLIAKQTFMEADGLLWRVSPSA